MQKGSSKAWDQLAWNREMRNSNKFTNDAMQSVRNVTKPMEKQTEKAHKKNSRTANLQLQLWNSGAFKGVIDKRTGKQVTYERAVDGLMGRMTRQAIENNKKRRENIEITHRDKPTEESNNSTNNTSNNLSFIQALKGNLSQGMLSYKDSDKEGLQAILEHKRKLNVNDPYAVIDKLNHTLNIYKKDSLLESHPIITGKNIGDGMFPTNIKYLGESPGTTPAGVFTIGHIKPTSDYIGHGPVLQLQADSISPNVSFSIHPPASNKRITGLNSPNGSIRNQSLACVNGKCGMTEHLIDNNLLGLRDSIYVLPQVEGNKMIEKNGRLQMYWGENNPTTYEAELNDGKGNKIKKTYNFRYNNKK